MPKGKEKVFRLTIELEEISDDETGLFPLFINGQVCSGIDQIKMVLELFRTRLTEFLENTLIPNKKER